MQTVMQFEELYVVSDLHLGGGLASKQIFNQGTTFAAFIANINGKSQQKRQGLVINGDLVDFLAEPYATYFDAAGALEKLDRIVRDNNFEPVWRTLREYVKTPNRTLIITLGNHDLELTLPWVSERLLQIVTDGDPTKRSRVVLAFGPGGFRCQIGTASILCVHGNEVDEWNLTDYDKLQDLAKDGPTSAAARKWVPNAGTKLVIEVMNSIKSSYPFVDLLKPEHGAVVPTLMVLDQKLIPKIGTALPSWFRSEWTKIGMATGFLSDEQLDKLGGDAAPPGTLTAMLGETFGPEAVSGQIEYDLDSLLAETERRFNDNEAPLKLLDTADREEFLGVWGAIKNLIFFRGKPEVLREALEKLQYDRGFDFDTEDNTFRELDARYGYEFDFIVAGHTHLERALPSRVGSGHYYNSGTWVRLIRLTDQLLASQATFLPVYNALSGYTMQALDATPNLILTRPTVVCFWQDGQSTIGELAHVSLDNSGTAVFSAVPRTRFEAGKP